MPNIASLEPIATRHRIPEDRKPKDEEKFHLMQKWLNDSIKRSTYCSKPTLPTRVLDLGSNNSSLTAPIRLRVTNFGEKGDYFTLSYRWGAMPWFTTTTESLTARCQRIDLRDLPIIFRDAVTVARRMSVRYLWIDALCILQDDLSDWSQESVQMGDIYQNSLCTLAIHHPNSNTEGFLSSALNGAEKVEVNLRPAGCLVKEVPFASFLRLPGIFELEIDDSPLSQRGWVLQERFLSMRILHFAQSEIYWEDTHRILSEPGSFPPEEDHRFTLPPRFSMPCRFRRGSYGRIEAKNRSWSAIEEWLQIVERYSRCDLTAESDKLPAIAGIASIFQKRTGYSYFAGMWSEDIHCGLLWLGLSAKLRHPKTRRAPSWAWPCYDGPLHFPVKTPEDHRFADDQHISDINFVGISDLPLSEANTHMLSLNWAEARYAMKIRASIREIRSFGGKTDRLACEYFPEDASLYSVYDDASDFPIGWACLDLEESLSISKTSLWCARIAHTDNCLTWINWVLFLVPADQRMNEYRRLGMGAIKLKSWFDHLEPVVIEIV